MAIYRIVLETSGLAEPGPIIQSFSRLKQARFDLRVVATLDGSRVILPSTGGLPYPAQIAAAQTIVITKGDLCGDEEIANARSVAAAINPLTELSVISDGADRGRDAFAWSCERPVQAVSAFCALPIAMGTEVSVILATWDCGTPTWAEVEE